MLNRNVHVNQMNDLHHNRIYSENDAHLILTNELLQRAAD